MDAPERRLARVRSLTRLLDSSIRIPLTRYRIGLDPLIGLVPWAGDVVGALLSTYLVWQSARLGAPRGTLVRMVANVAVETVAGVIPVLGDLFDAVWKANTRNLALLERHVRDPDAARRATRRFWLLLAGGLVTAVVGMVVAAAWVLRGVLGALGLG
jgi:hypothetical protein